MADNMHPTTKLIADTIAAGFAMSAYGFGVTARMFDVMSEAMSSATAPTTETKPAPEQKETKTAPATSATVLSFETAAKAKSTKPAAVKALAADDLKLIPGIGPKLEILLNNLGVSTLAQIAKWTKDDAARIDEKLKLNGRILRDDWSSHAKKIAKG